MRFVSEKITNYLYFVAVDATDNVTRETGLTSFTVYRSRNGEASALMDTPTINEVDAANMAGVYELLLDEDMTIDAANDSEEMVFQITHAGMAIVTEKIELYRKIANSVWDEPLSAHNTGGTAGKALKNASDFVVTSGTAQAGAGGQITLSAGESATDNIFNHSALIIINGTGVGQVRIITAYNGTTKVATISPNWVIEPDNTSEYQMMPALVHAASGWDTLKEGYAQSGTSTTIVLDSAASAIDDYYINQQVVIHSGTGAGQVRVITDYIGATKEVTINNAWKTIPDSTSQFIVQPDAHAPYVAGVILDTLLSGHTIDGTLGKVANSLTFTKANELDSNVQSINDVTITGDGDATPFNV